MPDPDTQLAVKTLTSHRSGHGEILKPTGAHMKARLNGVHAALPSRASASWFSLFPPLKVPTDASVWGNRNSDRITPHALFLTPTHTYLGRCPVAEVTVLL